MSPMPQHQHARAPQAKARPRDGAAKPSARHDQPDPDASKPGPEASPKIKERVRAMFAVIPYDDDFKIYMDQSRKEPWSEKRVEALMKPAETMRRASSGRRAPSPR